MKRIAFVRWVDSTSTKKMAHGDSLPLDFIENAGILVEDVKDHVTLAFYSNWDKDAYTETLTIPREAIKKMRRFKIED